VPAVVAGNFKLTAPEPSEKDIHGAVRDLLDLCLAPPAVWTPYPAGVTALSPAQFAQYSRFGLKRGFPDVLIFYDLVFGIELKRRGGRLSKTRIVRTRRGSPRELIGQEEMHAKLLGTGAFGAIAVARSVDDVCRLLDDWHIPRVGGRKWLAALSVRPLAEISAEPAPAGGGSA